MCKKCLWFQSHLDRVDIGQDIDENVLINQKSQIWQMSQAQDFAVLYALWVLPSQPNPRTSLGNWLGLHLGL